MRLLVVAVAVGCCDSSTILCSFLDALLCFCLMYLVHDAVECSQVLLSDPNLSQPPPPSLCCLPLPSCALTLCFSDGKRRAGGMMSMAADNNTTHTALHCTALRYVTSHYFTKRHFPVLRRTTPQLLAPLAPGSAVPVRQNPTAGAILLGIAGALWFVVLMFCFYFIRKV